MPYTSNSKSDLKLTLKMNNSKFIYFTLLLLIVISCKKNEITEGENDSVAMDSIEIQDLTKIRGVGVTLTSDARKKVENWKEYAQLDLFLEKFYSISPNEALNLSQELTTSTKQLKDSISIERFKQPDVSIRINVLHNATLRLADMSSIPKINPLEVQDETQNILDAFSALNSKINNLTKQEKIEAELKEFEVN